MTEGFGPAVWVRHDLSVDDTPVEHALDGDRLSFGHHIGILATRPKIDQGTPTAVIDDEFVAEHVGDTAADCGRVAWRQSVDRSRLQKHNAARLPILRDLHPTGAGGRAYD